MHTALAPECLLQLLAMLADGRAHSAEELADRVGLEPGELHAGIDQLVDHGVRQRRDGSLRIPGGIELLEAAAIEAALVGLQARATPVEVLGVTGSTNDDARRRLGSGGRPPFAVLAEAQQSGRGRRGRQWSSPVASNLYLTLAEALAGGPETSRGLSLAVGVAVAEGLGRVSGVDVDLKWPNDLLVGGAKLGGILVELAESGDRTVAIIGIGLNVRVPDYVARSIDQAWTDLVRAGAVDRSRNALAGSLIASLGATLDHFREHGFDARLRSRWQARDPFFGQRIVAIGVQGTLHGIERGIDDSGELLIETASGMERVGAGEVSIRLAPDAGDAEGESA
jgi:BirA family biotin operon repressor/biotin-[acetyl-CoA-carboxylase] ligase